MFKSIKNKTESIIMPLNRLSPLSSNRKSRSDQTKLVIGWVKINKVTQLTYEDFHHKIFELMKDKMVKGYKKFVMPDTEI